MKSFMLLLAAILSFLAAFIELIVKYGWVGEETEITIFGYVPILAFISSLLVLLDILFGGEE